ncbi:MAG: YopX family protein [Roseburia sp.]
MNDRYLYKAKRTDNREWVEGFLIYDERDNQYRIIEKLEYSTGTCIHTSYAPRVDRRTICQCTGLKDKNGKLIWENDIIKEFNSSGDEWNLSQIVFGEYSLNLGWCAKGIKTLHEYNRRLFNVGFGTSEAGKCEVVGNIFDNPELLEVES